MKYFPTKGKAGFLVWLYQLRRDDPIPAPWTDAGKRRIASLGLEMQVFIIVGIGNRIQIFLIDIIILFVISLYLILYYCIGGINIFLLYFRFQRDT